MQIIYCLIGTVVINLLAEAAGTPTPKPTPTHKPTPTPKPKHTPTPTPTPKPKAEKFSCVQCLGKGTDCKGTATGKICDYCAKIVGIVDSATSTPIWAEAILAAVKPGVKAKDYNGQTVTMKLCVSKASIEKAGYEAIASCSEFKQMGLKGYGCTCEGECQEPNSPNPPTTPAP